MNAPSAVRPLPEDDLEAILEATATSGLWEQARGGRFLITGGTGFFGLWLLESFAHANARLRLGARATVLTRDPAAFARKAPHLAAREEFTWLAGDIRSFPFPEGSFPFVVHAATESGAKLDAPAHRAVFDAIVAGTARVLDFASQSGTRRLLFISSGAVYGRQPADLPAVPEEYPGGPDPLDPASAYGEGKRAAENLCAIESRRGGYEAVVARCFAFVGPHLPLDGHFAAGNFLRDALHGREIRIRGDGTPLRSYLHPVDLTIWLWTLLFQGRGERAYNVGSGEAVSIGDLAREVASQVPGNPGVVIEGVPRPGIPPARYVPCVKRAEAELGLRVTIPLREALRRTLDYHRLPPAP